MTQDDKHAAIINAVRGILRPVARLLLANGITLQAITELVKQVLVEVAERDFALPGKPVNDSRVSVVTGVHRKDIRRLRSARGEIENLPKSVSLGSQLVNLWLTESRWQDAAGEPLVLDRVAGDHGAPSFEELAESISRDVRPRAILDELERLGVVSMPDDQRVMLNTTAFVPSAGLEEKLYYLQRAGEAHLSASVHNVQGEGPAFFDRVVHYDSIPAASLPALRKVVEQEGMRFLRRVNEAAVKASNREGEDIQAFTLGAYLHTRAISSPLKDDSEREK